MKRIGFTLSGPAIIERTKGRIFLSILLAMILSLGLITSAHAAEHKLTAGDGEVENNFGIDVCISGDYAIVGAHNDNDNGLASGSAYVFHSSCGTWTEQAKLTASDLSAADESG